MALAWDRLHPLRNRPAGPDHEPFGSLIDQLPGWVELAENPKIRLVRVPLDGGAEQGMPLTGPYRLTNVPIGVVDSAAYR